SEAGTRAVGRIPQDRLEIDRSFHPSLAKSAGQRYQETMNQIRRWLAIGSGIFLALVVSRPGLAGDPLVDVTRKIAAEATTNGKAYANLRELTTVGPRLSGSEGAAKGIEWAKRKLESYGFDHVALQPVMVPHWTRGDVEQASVTSTPHPIDLKVTALGPSVGTPKEGVEAGVVEVQGLNEVEKLGEAVRGKIVFYNRPMTYGGKSAYGSYGRTVDQRYRGASVAAKHGAVAVLVRSMTALPDDNHPHTGMLKYEDGIAKIPATAVSTHSANELSALLKSNPKLTVNLKLSAAQHPDAPSFNVMGELTGRDLPQEYVVVGGHLDSWDLGTGAHDDGTGVVQSIEVLRALKALGLRPRRTVRVVLFMAEEFGGIGATQYANQVKAKGEKHYAAIESDSGGFAPVGFGIDGGDAKVEALKRFAPYLGLVHADTIKKGGGGTDIEPLAPFGTITIGYIPDATHYFDFHHSSLDRLEAVNADELNGGAAAMATLTYLIAEKGL
ncbi:MAG TPA: M20/M25/M40 family metallo-hydrolase, partial [Planctomycetaceae bacterium]|nr:M20/M25/M40 family metallo-hydrolase [Planctomycetaceae bacterium]